MRHRSKLLIMVLMWLSCTASASTQEQLLTLLNNTTSIQASFTQVTRDRSGEEVNRSDGEMAVDQGGKFNIHTLEPFVQHLVSNGEDFYTFDVDLEQVVVRPLVKDANQVPILLLGDASPEFLQGFHITYVEEETHSIYHLQARDPGSVFERLNLIFVGNQPSGITLRDSLGQTTEIQLVDVVINESLPATRFEFVVPEGVDLIDDR